MPISLSLHKMQLLNCGYSVSDKMNNFPKQIVINK